MLALKPLSEPWEGPWLVMMANVNGSLLGALPVNVMFLAVNCCTVTDCGLATGAATTVMLTVAAELVKPVVVSVTVKVKLSGPV